MNTHFLVVFTLLFISIQTQALPARPLILVPNWGSSILHAQKGEHVIRAFINMSNPDYSVKEYLWCKFNKETNLTESLNQEYKIVVPFDNFGLFAIDNLNPGDEKRPRYYFHHTIQFLKNLGYEPGKTLFGFPYDWRQSTLLLAKQFHEYVESITESQNSTEVDIIAHGFGGIVVKTYLGYNVTHKIHNLITVATPFKRAGVQWFKQLVHGTNFDIPNLDPKIVQTMMVESPSSYVYGYLESTELQSPSQIVYSTDKEKISITSQEYFNVALENLSNLTTCFQEQQVSFGVSSEMLELEQQAAILRSKVTSETQPKYFYNIVGTMIETPHSMEYAIPVKGVAEILSQEPVITKNATGDGTLIWEEMFDDGLETCKLCRPSFYATHDGLLSSTEVHDSFQHFLGLSCPWEGIWNVSWVTVFKEQMRLKQFGWNVTSDKYQLKGILWGQYLRGTLIGRYGTGHFEIKQSEDCSKLTGYWKYDVSGSKLLEWKGARVIGEECQHNEKRNCSVEHGVGYQKCIYGVWNEFCFVEKCDQPHYSMSVGEPFEESTCVKYKVVEEVEYSIKQIVLIGSFALPALSFVVFFAMKAAFIVVNEIKSRSAHIV